MALKQVKNKIISTQKTGKVTKAMEAVSAVKMRKSQDRALSGKAYAEAAVRMLMKISQSKEISDQLSKKTNDSGAHCFIVITSDKGLAGALNSAVLKEVDKKLSTLKKDEVEIIAFGRKALEHYERLGYKVAESFVNVSDDVVMADVEEVAKSVLKNFNSGHYSTVSVSYQSFISTFEQMPVLREILPLNPATLAKMVKDIVPRSGLHSEEVQNVSGHNYTVEPSAEAVFESLLPQLFKIMVYHSLLENKASEHSARMVAMKNATDKSKEMVKALTIEYNKERQAAITAEVSEITAGVQAMST